MMTAEEALAELLLPTPSLGKVMLHRDVFGPRPADLLPFVENAKSRFGEDSFEYAQELLGMGDAQMVQCDNAGALASYESALAIYQKAGEDTLLTAWAYHRLGIVRQLLGDLAGAVADWSHALEKWDRLGDVALPEQMARQIALCRERWETGTRVLEFESRKPPEL